MRFLSVILFIILISFNPGIGADYFAYWQIFGNESSNIEPYLPGFQLFVTSTRALNFQYTYLLYNLLSYMPMLIIVLLIERNRFFIFYLLYILSPVGGLLFTTSSMRQGFVGLWSLLLLINMRSLFLISLSIHWSALTFIFYKLLNIINFYNFAFVLFLFINIYVCLNIEDLMYKYYKYQFRDALVGGRMSLILMNIVALLSYLKHRSVVYPTDIRSSSLFLLTSLPYILNPNFLVLRFYECFMIIHFYLLSKSQITKFNLLIILICTIGALGFHYKAYSSGNEIIYFNLR